MPSRSPRTLPMVNVPQLVPSQTCLTCEVCCRFPERNSPLRPYFRMQEIDRAIAHGLAPIHFSDHQGCHITVIPHPHAEGYICPAFDPLTQHCQIYEVRPLDCQLYPFLLMWDPDRTTVLLGWDRKCPFLLQTSPHTVHPLSSSELAVYAHHLSTTLDGPETAAQLAQTPKLITCYQDDVVIVAELKRLTHHLVH
ncbi:MAG: YkgJ family cysteine cluster protein [Nitrospirae bacterium]|nr:MAG: YkgJ family cysteine cluster protein [Nitrospirota bacterium]